MKYSKYDKILKLYAPRFKICGVGEFIPFELKFENNIPTRIILIAESPRNLYNMNVSYNIENIEDVELYPTIYEHSIDDEYLEDVRKFYKVFQTSFAPYTSFTPGKMCEMVYFGNATKIRRTDKWIEHRWNHIKHPENMIYEGAKVNIYIDYWDLHQDDLFKEIKGKFILNFTGINNYNDEQTKKLASKYIDAIE